MFMLKLTEESLELFQSLQNICLRELFDNLWKGKPSQISSADAKDKVYYMSPYTTQLSVGSPITPVERFVFVWRANCKSRMEFVVLLSRIFPVSFTKLFFHIG